MRLLAGQGRRDEARVKLAEIYGWSTEGFDTANLKEAKALLDWATRRHVPTSRQSASRLQMEFRCRRPLMLLVSGEAARIRFEPKIRFFARFTGVLHCEMKFPYARNEGLRDVDLAGAVRFQVQRTLSKTGPL